MRSKVEAAARAKWSNVNIVRVLDLTEDSGLVVTVGTLFKEMSLKPSILDEYTKDRGLDAHNMEGKTRFTHPSDRVVLEDEGARVVLTGENIDPGRCVTGVVAAVCGKVLPNGEFEVRGMCFAGLSPQSSLQRRIEIPEIGIPERKATDKYVALVSGLSLGDSKAASKMIHLQMFVDYCCGALGGEREHEVASQIVRVVIAGGVLHGTTELSQPTAYSTLRKQATTLAPLREADVRLTELASGVPVDLMPGASDPANYSLPQQPLHQCLFPGATKFGGHNLNRCTNPHDFEVDGVRFLGTAGQNVDDVARYSTLEDRVVILSEMLQWGHLIPTAPDTLSTYPFYDADPFIIEECPHVLFAGGQPDFGTALVRGQQGQTVRVISIPNIATSGIMVLVNLRTLAVHPIHFEMECSE